MRWELNTKLLSRLCGLFSTPMFIGCFWFLTTGAFAQMGVGITPPDAMLDLTSTTQGLLMPRMTTVQRDAIVSPATSLLIYNNTTTCFEAYYSGTWISLRCLNCQLPGTFTDSTAINITAAAFDAKWGVASSVTTYYLDVSTVSSFASFVPGYNNLNVGNVVTYNVSGLTSGTTYYYRIRPGNSCGIRASSNTITVTTL